MKKAVLSLVLVGALMVTVGCGNKASVYEETMKEYATQFYNAHVKGTEGLTKPTVSIKQLKNSAGKVEETYDMTKLEGCTDESYVELILEENSTEIKDYAFHLDCPTK